MDSKNYQKFLSRAYGLRKLGMTLKTKPLLIKNKGCKINQEY